VFADAVAGNPKAEVEIRVAPDGAIIGRRLVKSSGLPAWDEAVLRAIDKAESLPRDTDGRVQNPTLIVWGPKD
jgi:colicin import membrane protein